MGTILTIIFLIVFFEYIKQQINELTLLSLENKERKDEDNIFLSQWIYVFIGLVYIFIEIGFLLLTGHSWCDFSGCKLVQSLMGKDENKLVILGNTLFLFLLFLEILKLEAKRKEIFFKLPAFNKYNPVLIIEKVEGFFLILATIIEGFFFAIQVFILKDICLFCIGIMFIILANFIVWCLRNKSNKDLAIGLIGFVAIFYMTAFMVGLLKLNSQDILNKKTSQEKVLNFNQTSLKNLPCSYLVENGNNLFYLFASKTCPHCKNVENFLKENKKHLNVSIKLCLVDKKQNLEFLKSKNIEFIPVLFSKEGYFLASGDKDIIDFLKKFIKKNISYKSTKSINNFKNYQTNSVNILPDENQNIDQLFKEAPICTFNSTCE